MMAWQPLFWVCLAWMVFPLIALVIESSDGITKLRPWASESTSAADSTATWVEQRKWSCANARPAWRGDKVLRGRILFVSVGFHGHAMPLLALAEEVALRGHEVTFGTHAHFSEQVESISGVDFLSAGRMPMHDHQLRAKLKSLSQAGGFWGLLTLLNDVYLPLMWPMYRALLAGIGSASAPTHVEANDGTRLDGEALGQEAQAASEHCAQGDERETFGRVYPSTVDGGSESSGFGAVGDGGQPGTARDGDRADGEMGSENRGPAAGAPRNGDSVCVPQPFDLVVVDVGSLGGLFLAQKLGIPYMFNSPSLMFDLSGRFVTATLPGWGTGMARRMSFGGRLQNAISPRALSVFLTPAFISVNKARREEGLEPYQAQDDIFHGARMLVNTAFGLEYPHDVAPLVDMTGPLFPPRIARALASPRFLAPSHAAVPGAPPYHRRSSNSSDERGSPGADGMGFDGMKTKAHSNVDDGTVRVDPEFEKRGGSGVDQGSKGSKYAVSMEEEGVLVPLAVGDDDGILSLPHLIGTWLGGSGALVAPDTAAYNSIMKQVKQASKQSSSPSGSAADISSLVSGSVPHADQGVIYVSLGRMPQLETWQLAMVLQALSSEDICWRSGGVDGAGVGIGGGGGGGIGVRDGVADDGLGRHRVLWAMPREQRAQLLGLLQSGPPPYFRIKVMDGLPHLGILAHPAVKAVVSHCGTGAVQEALVFGKPLLCLPVLAEQQDVAQRVIDTGAGLSLSGLTKNNVTAAALRSSLNELVTNPSFRRSARVLSGILRRAGGTLRAADIVEGTLQLGGAEHLHPPELHGPWHQTSSTDAFSFLAACLILVAILGYALLAALCYVARLLILKALRSLVVAMRKMSTTQTKTPEAWRPWGSRGDDGREAEGRVGDGGGRVAKKGSGARGGKGGALTSADTRESRLCLTSGEISPRTSTARAAAAAAAATAGNGTVSGFGSGGLWDEALTLLGGPGPPDPFPEDSLPELDGPAIDRFPAPLAGGRGGVGSSGSRSGGANGLGVADGSRGNGAAVGAGGAGGTIPGAGSGAGSGSMGLSRGGTHLRLLSGEVVTWSTAPNESRAFDPRGWTIASGSGGSGGVSGGGGGGCSSGNDVAPHCAKRLD